MAAPATLSTYLYGVDVRSKKRKAHRGLVYDDPKMNSCSWTSCSFTKNATVSVVSLAAKAQNRESNGVNDFDLAIDQLQLESFQGMDTSGMGYILELDDLGEPLKKKKAIGSSCSRPRVIRVLSDIDTSRNGAVVAHAEMSLEEEQIDWPVDGKVILEVDTSVRAFNLAHEMQQLYSTFPSIHGIKLFGSNVMKNLAEAFFDEQRTFALDGKDATVSIGYHFTQQRNLDDIQRHGLICRKERDLKNIRARRRSGYYGEGIYTGNNPYAFTSFGPVGLLVATLKGKSERVGPRGGLNHTTELDSCVGNKNLHKTSPVPNKDDVRASFTDEIVLKRASQVLPLLIFPTNVVSGGSRSVNANALWNCHVQIQKVIDDHFHCGIASVIERVVSPHEYAL